MKRIRVIVVLVSLGVILWAGAGEAADASLISSGGMPIITKAGMKKPLTIIVRRLQKNLISATPITTAVSPITNSNSMTRLSLISPRP